jgi:hypothetical protein
MEAAMGLITLDGFSFLVYNIFILYVDRRSWYNDWLQAG